jgi:hypothetical protein
LRVEPEAALHAEEWRLIDRLAAQGAATPPACEFAVELVERVEAACALPRPSEGAPAAVHVRNGRVLLSQHRFAAELDPENLRGRLAREKGNASGLAVTLRVAAACFLPGSDALPLHAAAVVVAGSGVVFVGVSGAGKSTLARTSPWPVLSDEEVVLRGPQRWRVEASPLLRGHASVTRASAPLHAVLDLEKSDTLELSRLSSAEALRRIARVVLVPAHASVWSETLRALCRLVESVPVYRLAWARQRPPWGELEALLATPWPGGSPR